MRWSSIEHCVDQRVRLRALMKYLADIFGESAGIEAIREKVVRLLERQQDARRLSPARLIHRAGPRPEGPFVDVDCARRPSTGSGT